MKISIITPTWNRCDSLSRMIQSVEVQALRPFEHLVIDNLSTDGTASVVSAYAARAPYSVIHMRNGDKGIYDAMNQGAAIAQGDALYFLNDDDSLFRPNSLALLSAALKLAPGGVAFGDVIVRDPTSRAERRRNHRQMNRLTLAEKSICQQATIYSRKAFDTVGFFDAELKAAGDYDWMLRALVVHRLGAVYLRHPVAMFSTGGISSDPAWRGGFESEMAAVAARHLDRETFTKAKAYRRIWRKIPWGRALMPESNREDDFGIRTRSSFAARLCLDPLSWLDF
jgi:glycosyltransferase involved in cell wall biosynthesis